MMHKRKATGVPAAPSSNPSVLVLMYHQVGLFSRPRKHKGLYCHVDRFRWQMAHLARSRAQVISLQAACDGLFHGGALPDRSVVLTFDDGYRNFHDFAWPVLQRYGLPATVFMVAGRIGGTAEWLQDGGQTSTLMDAPTLRSLADQGVTIGSHTVSHRRLGELDIASARHEIRDSKTRLEDALGRTVAHFSYPYGHYTPAVRDAVREAGFSSALTCIRGRAERADSAYEIPRQGISYKDTCVHYAYKLNWKHRHKTSSGARAR